VWGIRPSTSVRRGDFESSASSKHPRTEEDEEEGGGEDQDEEDDILGDHGEEEEEEGTKERNFEEELVVGRKRRRRSPSPSPSDFFFSYAPSLSFALQERLSGLFRDNTLRSTTTNKTYFPPFSSFWRRFEEALPPSCRPLFPLSTPDALCRWLVETPHIHALFVHLTQERRKGGRGKGLSGHGLTAIAIVLGDLGLRLTQPWEGELRIVSLLERVEGEERGERQEEQRRRKIQQFRKLLKGVSFFTPSLSRWLIRRVCENRTYKTAYLYLCCLRRALLTLRPSLPPSSSSLSTPASLQAAFLHPTAMRALLLYHRGKEEARRGKNRVAAQAMSALTIFLNILDLRVVGMTGWEEEQLVVGGMEGRREGRWKGWKGEGADEEEEEMEEEGEREEGLLLSRNLRRRGPRRFVYPSLFPHAPSLSPALQSELIGLFRDDISRLRSTNNEYYSHFHPFWQSFEQVLPPSLRPFPPSPAAGPFIGGCSRRRACRRRSCS